jgi:hypothetical protein
MHMFQLSTHWSLVPPVKASALRSRSALPGYLKLHGSSRTMLLEMARVNERRRQIAMTDKTPRRSASRRHWSLLSMMRSKCATRNLFVLGGFAFHCTQLFQFDRDISRLIAGTDRTCPTAVAS